ncbi:MAG TPA: choice-of-anchor E domain-containing protein [Chitinophagaceae bacterium]|nr:choice-of-anchor E domain-containing protein [Chitinophagaceae bacterium]
MKKQLYTLLFILGSCLAANEKASAQCPCTNGDTPDSTVHRFTLPPTSDFSSAITFPKFNPGTGTLNCVSLEAIITAVANLGIRNRDSMQRDYQFMYTQSISVSGPGGLFTNATTNTNYGPATLEPYGMPGDSIHWGPDTPFVNRRLTRTISNVSPYLGTGNVTLNFNNTGSTLLLQGSNNYQSTITTYAWGEFRLVYYWCSASVLASGLKGFTATKKDKTIDLQWVYENEPANTNYDIQLSRDGYAFDVIAKRNGSTGTSGVIHYDHQYQVNGDEGKLYFRIKATRPGGGVQYSPIRLVRFDGKPGSFIISPNPVKTQTTVSFARPQSGDFGVEIVNAVGQAVYRKVHTLSNETSIEVVLPQQQAPGLYYLRVNNIRTKEQSVQKILLQ